MYKTPQCRSKFGSWDVEKVHAVVARSTFRSQKCQKTDGFGALLDVHMSFCVAGLRDYAPGQKWAKCEGFLAFPKTMAGVGHMQRISQDVFLVAGTIQVTCSSELFGGQGADFLRGVAFWSIRSSGLLRWFCGVEKPKNALVWGRQLCWLSIFEGSLAELFCFWCCQLQKNWGSLAELFRFWCCQVQKLRKSRRIVCQVQKFRFRRIVLFLMLSNSKIEEVSQNCFGSCP